MTSYIGTNNIINSRFLFIKNEGQKTLKQHIQRTEEK